VLGFTDVLEMANRVEIREPLPDDDLIEYAPSLPGHVEAAGRYPNSLLAGALGNDLLARVGRRSKMVSHPPSRGGYVDDARPFRLHPHCGGSFGSGAQAVAEVWHSFQVGTGTWVRPAAMGPLRSQVLEERHLV
jgi:hypothetical protein